MQPPAESDRPIHKISVILVDRHIAVRQLLGMLLVQCGLFDVVGEASSADEAMEIFSYIIPQMVIMDLQLPEVAGIGLLKHLRKKHRSVRILVFSLLEPPASLGSFDERPHGYLSKSDSLETLEGALKIVAAGGLFWTSEAARALERSNGPDMRLLSERQLTILSMVASGMSSKQISARLALSSKTIDNQRRFLMKKLSLKNASGLTRYAINQGIVSA